MQYGHCVVSATATAINSLYLSGITPSLIAASSNATKLLNASGANSLSFLNFFRLAMSYIAFSLVKPCSTARTCDDVRADRVRQIVSMVAVLCCLLYAQNFERLNRRGLGKQLGRLRHKRLGDRTVQMRLTSLFVGKCVENAERCWAQPQSEPEERFGLLFGHCQAGFQELGDFVFL